MKYYLLNTLADKIEVYETVYVPEKIIGDLPAFYSNSTLFIYRGSLPLYWRCFNRKHSQVEQCKNGDCRNQPYYGSRTIGQHFFPLKRYEVIERLRNAPKPEPLQ